MKSIFPFDGVSIEKLSINMNISNFNPIAKSNQKLSRVFNPPPAIEKKLDCKIL